MVPAIFIVATVMIAWVLLCLFLYYEEYDDSESYDGQYSDPRRRHEFPDEGPGSLGWPLPNNLDGRATWNDIELVEAYKMRARNLSNFKKGAGKGQPDYPDGTPRSKKHVKWAIDDSGYQPDDN